MSNLTAKQKIIIGLVVFVMLIVIGIYGYMALNENGEEIDIQNMENSNELQEGEEADEGEDLETEKNNEENKFEEKSEQETENAEQSKENQSNNETNQNKSEEKKYESLQNLEGKIVVHITGAVKETGILVLPEGARIADAIELANGTTKEADLDQVNLAYILEDGQKIYIPTKADKKASEPTNYITSDAGKNVIVDSKNSSETNEANVIININTATQSELEKLPGIGESTAKAIIEYREVHGKFEKIEDLKNIKGIGDAKLKNIRAHIVVK